MGETSIEHPEHDFVASDETLVAEPVNEGLLEDVTNQSATDSKAEVTENQAVEISPDAQTTLDKLENVLAIWNDNVKGKIVTPFGGRVQEYQLNNIPTLENLKFDLQAGKTTFVDMSDMPIKKTRLISEKLNEIYRGLTNLQ